MANIKSQIKRNKQNEKARVRNKAVKSSLKTSVRQFREAADTGDAEKVAETMRAALTKLDKAPALGGSGRRQRSAGPAGASARRVRPAPGSYSPPEPCQSGVSALVVRFLNAIAFKNLTTNGPATRRPANAAGS